MRWAAFPHQSENFTIGSLVHAGRRGPMAILLSVALGLMPSATTRQISSRPVRLQETLSDLRGTVVRVVFYIIGVRLLLVVQTPHPERRRDFY